MAVNKVTATEFSAKIAAGILARNNSYDVAVGPIADLVIRPVAGVLEQQNDRIRQVQSLLSLVNNGDFTHADLVAFAQNEEIQVDLGRPSTVTLIFSVSIVTSDRTVRAGYPVATVTDETTGQALTFVVQQDTTLPNASKSSYFNPNTQKYELPVTAQCVVGGIQGNVAANRITKPLRPLVGFDQVFNRDAAQGGRDATSDQELIDQYLIAITGTDPGVPDGTQRVVRDLFTPALDSLVVFGSDPLLTRAATDAGAVDLWVLGSQTQARTDAATFIGVGQPVTILKQPVLQVLSVTSGITTYVQGVDYNFVQDTTGTYAHSVKGQDAIVFLSGGAAPASGASLTIQYTQNVLIDNIQAIYLTTDENVLGRNILVREAMQKDIVISANLKVRSGYNPTSVLTLAQDNIINFVNALLLNARIPGVSDGGSLQISDIDREVRNISGVDNFVTTVFDLVGGVGNADIVIAKNQYPRLAALDLTITLV